MKQVKKALRWQFKNMARGLCRMCGKRPPKEGKKRCQICLTKAKEYRQKDKKKWSEYGKVWRLMHPGYMRKYSKKWRKSK